MKKTLFLFLMLFLTKYTTSAQMILVFDTSLSSGTSISLPLSTKVNVDVDWGDGNIKSYVNTDNISHTYASEGIYTVEINGTAERFGIGEQFNYVGGDKLIEVTSFGDLGLTSLKGAFKRAINLVVVPDNIPPTVIDVSHMFNNATSFNSNIGGWNVANITNMDYVFYYAKSFNNDIGSWDVSNVTSMDYMFGYAHSFDQDIGGWNVGNVKSMKGMFSGTTHFNRDIGDWDVANVRDMSAMFSSALYFDQDIGKWNVGNAQNMESMFNAAYSFNQFIGMWDVSNVINMQGMFYSAETFNQDISSWDVGNVTDMSSMFAMAYAFNQNIGAWNVSHVTNMLQLFYQAGSFNHNIGSWNVGKVTQMYNMFTYAESFNQDIGMWDVGNVTDMTSMFSYAHSFDQDLGNWDVSNVLSMDNMFSEVELSTANYDNLLMGWATRDLKPGILFNAGSSRFSPGAAAEARDFIINTFGWTIFDDGMIELPIIMTIAAYDITPDSAVCGGVVSSDGGYEVTAKGVVWHTDPDPTIDIYTGITNDGSGIGPFTSILQELEIGTIYFVRAYAVNSLGTAYGNTIQFRAAKELTLIGDFTVMDRIYDGTTAAEILTNNLVIEGILGEYENVFPANFVVSFNDSQVGDTKPVSIISASLQGDHKDYYYLSLEDAPMTTGNIDPMELTIGGTITAYAKLYDGTIKATISENNLTLLTPVLNDDIAIGSVELSFEDASDGKDKKVYISSAVLGGDHKHNYTLTFEGSPVTYANIILPGDDQMVLVYDTRLSEGTTISLPLYSNVDVTVFWGDGKSNVIKSDGNHEHIYDKDDIYTITIDGSLESFGYFFGFSGIDKLVEVVSFGNMGIIHLSSAFKGAVNLIKVPDKLPATVRNLSFMLMYTHSFNQDIGGWDMSNVTDMKFMFSGATLFNQNIGQWDVGNVTDMRDVFSFARSFDQDIGQWDVENVTDMSGMFSNASSFNQYIGEWNVCNVSNMSFMFNEATSFNQDIGQWDVSKVTDMSYMFSDAKLSVENYNKLLIGWASLNLSPGLTFHAGTSKYSFGAAAEAKEHIIKIFNWTITDGGMELSSEVHETISSLVQVYPNPFTNHIKVKSTLNISRIVLSNITGQTEMVAKTMEEIHVENLKEGIYFLRIEFVNHPTQVVKVIKN
jgi:surface protein